MWKRSLALTTCLLAIACGDDAPPRIPTAPPRVIPPIVGPLSRTITGRVTDGNFAVPEATAEIVAGLGTGTVRTSGPDGYFTMPPLPQDAGEVRIVARHDGFRPRELIVTITPESPPISLDFTLEPLSFANIAGVWRLTVEAAPSCDTLPEAARTRQYVAAIEQSGALATLRLQSGDFLWPAELGATVYATSARVRTSCGWVPCIIERLPSGETVTIAGFVELSLDSNRLSGSLDGSFDVYPPGNLTTASASCTSSGHRFTLER